MRQSKVQKPHHLPVKRGDAPLAFHSNPEASQTALSADFANHLAGLTFDNGFHGVGAEPRCETSVSGCRASAALDVAEDADAVFVSAEFLELFSDTERAALDPFRNDDNAAGLAAMATSAEPFAHGSDVHGPFGYQDFLGSARDPDRQG